VSRRSVFIDEIDAAFIERECAAVFAGIHSAATSAAEQRIREESRAAQEAAVTAASAAAVLSERERVTGILDASVGLGLDVQANEYIRNGTSVADATRGLLDATRAAAAGTLAAIVGAENKFTAPKPGTGADPTPEQAAKSAVELARKAGILQK